MAWMWVRGHSGVGPRRRGVDLAGRCWDRRTGSEAVVGGSWVTSGLRLVWVGNVGGPVSWSG